MKIALISLTLVASVAPLSWSQTASPAVVPPPAQTSIKPKGPDAIAAQDPSRVVATINGQKITAKQADDLLKRFPPEQRKQFDSNLSSAIQQIYTQRQLAEAAQKMKLDEKSPWKEQLELTREGVMARAYINQMSESAAAAPAEDPKKYYDAHQAEFDNSKLSGIFVSFNPPGTPAAGGSPSNRTEQQASEKATDLEKKLKAGGEFAALARSDSDHQSASKGGELGTYALADPNVTIPPDIKNAVAKLSPGQFSEPIKIPNAFLIIRLDSREKVSYEQAKDGIVQKMKTERTQSAVKQELDKYTIHVDDPDFFESPGGVTAPKIPSLQR